jgi:LuxR family maltose regulon positive regulatory protein
MTARGLLPTKLHPRQIRPQTVARPRLVAALEQLTTLPVTLVLGPAGAGKSTAVVAWVAQVERTERDVAWLSLDPSDDDLNRFLAYVLAALHTVEPGVGADAGALLAAPPLADVEAWVADELVIPLASRPRPLVLVLDDLHALADAGIHAALAWLIEHMPACLHLLIISRTEPELGLARLRARGELGELGVEQLRFVFAEARSFYADVMGLALADETIAALEQRTEGWPVGAQLAALSCRAGTLELPRGDDRLFADYLLREVFGRLDPGLQELLLATCLLERVCAPLAAVMTEDEQARARLDELERANLFLIPLDSHARWFRYHHLFRDFLREHASARAPEWRAARHRAAAEWLARHEHRQEAFEHAVASGDEALIVELFERWAAETLIRNQTGEVRRWLRLVPAELREREAALWFIDGWCDVVVGQLRTGLHKLERARAAHALRPAGAQAQQLMAWLGTVLEIAALLRAGRYDEALAQSREARSVLEPRAAAGEVMPSATLSGYLMHEALVHLDRDELAQAQPLLERAVELVKANKGLAVTCLARYAQLLRRSGRLDDAELHARRALRYAEESNTSELASGGLARVELAWVAFERGDPRLALGEVAVGLERLRLARDVAYLAHASELLALATAAQGQPAEAIEVVDEAIELLADTDMAPALARMVALRERLLGPRGTTPIPVAPELVVTPSEELTERELEVLTLAATGLSNRELAKRLYVSVGTVKTHMHRILAKLDAPNRTRAVHRARAAGLIR